MSDQQTTRDFISRNPRPGMILCTDPQCSPAFGHPHYHEGVNNPPPHQTTDINLNAKLVETIAPLLAKTSGLNAGLVGRATLKRAQQIVDATFARIAGEGCKIVKVDYD